MPKSRDTYRTSVVSMEYNSDYEPLIYRYHSGYRPHVQFYLTPSEVEQKEDNLYIGFELEFDYTKRTLSPTDKKRVIKDNNNILRSSEYLYYMLDGSVRNGLEMISQPSTYKFYLLNRNNFENVFNSVKSHGYVASSACGLHFHINKDFFSSDLTSDEYYSSLQKLLTIWDKFWPDLVKLSKRTPQKLYRWAGKYNISPNAIVNKIVDCNVRGERNPFFSKYMAVNLNHNDTIEFRIFSSTLDLDEFYAMLKFVVNVAYTAKYKDDEYIKDCEFQSLISGKNLTKFYFKNCLKGKTKYKPFDIKFYDPEKGYKVKKKKWDDALREYRIPGTLIYDESAALCDSNATTIYDRTTDPYSHSVTTYTSSVNTVPTAYDSAVIDTASNIAALSGVTTADVISSLNTFTNSISAADWAYPVASVSNSSQ